MITVVTCHSLHAGVRPEMLGSPLWLRRKQKKTKERKSKRRSAGSVLEWITMRDTLAIRPTTMVFWN